MGELCKHDLEPGQCGYCRPRPHARRAGPRTPAATAAEYHGRCSAECGQQITPGDLIVPDPAGDGWMHQDCW
jgi:hypothetical protein